MALVFVYHFGLFAIPLLEVGSPLAAPSTWGARVIPNLQLGVEIFFVLSGFLIYLPFARARQDGTSVRIVPYVLRRALRIYPAYWVALVVLIVRDDIYVNGAANFVKHATLTQSYFADRGLVGTREPGMVVAWTLVVEMSFYVFVPIWATIVARRVSVRTEIVALSGLTALGFFVRWWAVHHAVWPWVSVLPPAMAALAPGMLCAIAVVRRDRWREPWIRIVRARWLWFAAAAAVFLWLIRVAYGSPLFAIFIEGEALAWHKLLAPLVGVLIVAPVVLIPKTSGKRTLAHPALVAVGTVSYGGYLWHHSLMYHHIDRDVVNDMTAFNASLLMAGLFAFVLAVAAASWFLIERPSLRLADRLARRRG
jgi:peptidoglycan/LPS O-acetylase OafA/YrhL